MSRLLLAIKIWWYKVWVSEATPDVADITVDYWQEDYLLGNPPAEQFSAALQPLAEAAPFGLTNYKGFYASTYEATWETLGTEPVGDPGLYPIGNPLWAAFHLDVAGTDPVVVQVFDECLP